MTFPVVSARTTTVDGSATFTRAINLGGPVAGDLLIVISGTRSGGGMFVSESDWHEISNTVEGALRKIVLAKIATGTDALTIVTGGSVRLASVCYRITGHGSYIGFSATSATSGNGNPPSAGITGGAQDTLFIASNLTPNSISSAAPSGYSSLTTASAGTVFLACAELTANATADDPGTFTNTSQDWIATTSAIPELTITTAARQSQEVVEAISLVSTNAARATQIATEVVSRVSNNVGRATQVVVEIISENVPNDGVAGGPSMILIAT